MSIEMFHAECLLRIREEALEGNATVEMTLHIHVCAWRSFRLSQKLIIRAVLSV